MSITASPAESADADAPEKDHADAEIPQAALRSYYTRHLAELPDVLTVRQISAATGYNVRTVGQWLCLGRMRCLMLDNAYHVPKGWAIDYLCSDQHNSTRRKGAQHIAALWAACEYGRTGGVRA